MSRPGGAIREGMGYSSVGARAAAERNVYCCTGPSEEVVISFLHRESAARISSLEPNSAWRVPKPQVRWFRWVRVSERHAMCILFGGGEEAVD